MSENTPKKPTSVEVYKENSVIKINLHVNYITRFNQLLLEFIPFKDENHVLEVMGKVAKGEQDEPFSYHVTTLVSFLALVEEAAKEQDLLETLKLNSNGEVVNDDTTSEKTSED